jgi:hypothetical protein
MNPSRICPVSQVLRDPTGGWGPDYWREAEVAAAARELTLLMLPISGLKPYTGHMGAASDIAEIALAALENGLVGNVEFSDGGSRLRVGRRRHGAATHRRSPRALDESGTRGPVTGHRRHRRSGSELKTGSARLSP